MSWDDLGDYSPMPFGKHKGRPMMDVPADYFHWLWEKGMSRDHGSNVANYIRKNLDALKQENENLIWTEGTIKQKRSRPESPVPFASAAPRWWEVFGLDRGSTEEAVMDRFRKLSKVWHPDVGGHEGKMKELNAALEAFREERKP